MMAAAAASDSAENQSEVKPEGQSSPCGGCPRKQSGGSCPGKQGGGCGGCCKRRAAMMAAAAASDNAENQSEVKPEGQSSPCGGCPRKQSGGGCPGRQGGGCCKKQGGCSGCPGKQGGCCRNQGGSPCANCPGKQGGCCRNQGGSPCANCPGKQGGCCRSQGGSPCANCPNRNFCPSASANAGCPGIDSENRGMASACEGCPNRAFCMSNKIVVDPDLDIIKKKMETIKHKVLILSGKGGVGKSTLSSQLAYTIGRDEDIQIGLCDVDITGPSQPIIMGAENEPVHQSNTGITPVYVQDNLAVMSIGFLLEKQDESVIWRGPKKNGLIKHFLKDVEWGDLDLLLFDTPPGTSDEHLSIVQYLKGCDIDGAILISTPQEISIQDVRKEINFCKKVNMPILGIVENMSGFVCPSCKGESIIFPATNGGVKALCEEINVPFLGAIPLDPRIVNSCDVGEPFVDSYPESPASKRYIEISKKIKEMLNLN
ncbi:P-loop containing nucleoside triphosphate hydrolase protein [Neocallimastix californiae]|uniref:p-loop containing nucleoside triphosphate hydrolase protein n=1 Tax=Neocallimastix californiae TaxID=1754190 RepID=A0A1Y2C4D2_9FUNG|nr:P-loop containing nucleoside triphosphate hydrolase protein [Neocallimastix californiae]|eukprot:ORY41806.1 P-loop containing nucleoside triphosphate hydrolase protein [Neocallimastix californiae]